MRLLVVNPNSTASMTDKIAVAARLVANPGTEIIAINPTDTPPRSRVSMTRPFACRRCWR